MVTVVAPLLSSGLAELAATDRLVWRNRRFRSGDTDGFLLAFAATDDPQVNQAVATDAADHKTLVNVVDAPETSTFTSPALLQRGELTIAVSTNGAAPVLARYLRDELALHFGDEYARVVAIMAAVRQKLLTDCANKAYNSRIFEHLAVSDLPRFCRDDDNAAIDRLLGEIAGNGYSLEELGLTAKGLS
jgi:precorrin-2 dehydrogenase/sirohydrochlorin ferrochelatase